MRKFNALYLPIGVPTFHKESIDQQFHLSKKLLASISDTIEIPEEPLLTVPDLLSFIQGKDCDLIILQNNAFANSEYTSEILRHLNADILLWTLQEPVIDGGRLRLNSLTGAYSAANLMHHFGKVNFEYIWGSPMDESVIKKIKAVVAAAALKKELQSLTLASIGHTPQGFGFGRGIDAEIGKYFGMKHIAVEVRELMDRAKKLDLESCSNEIKEVEQKLLGLSQVSENNRNDFIRLYKAYFDFIKENNIAAISSRCWPDFFVDFGTPVCAVLGMLNDNQIAASCEADAYGALSMLIGMKLSHESVFFGDPVSLDKEENTVTYWHCGTAACSLAHPNQGTQIGVHPNRKIGPTMEYGCKPSEEATVFRVGRKPDGSIRFFIATGKILDKEQQFLGTSLVFESQTSSIDLVSKSVSDGWEPHFIVAYKDIKDELMTLGKYLNAEICHY
ncbi:MAG: fucose isomerase [Clostridia bacterium]|nr:fucose isomerase [Clostridia bacterium]